MKFESPRRREGLAGALQQIGQIGMVVNLVCRAREDQEQQHRLAKVGLRGNSVSLMMERASLPSAVEGE